MPTALPDIDFHQIRPYGQPPSRANGFEELASILIERGIVEWPDGVRFERFGNPDGGREGRGVLPNGDVWAWQAKYLFELDSDALGQVTASVRRVSTREPTLKRLYVAFPLDRPAGDTEDRASAHTRWAEKVSEWEQMARDRGLTVEFNFIGAHDIVTALTEPPHAGRARYWFSAGVLTPDWQDRRLQEAVEKAGPRYTPRLHVEVDTVEALDALGRVDDYAAQWQMILADLREVRRWQWRAPGDLTDIYAEALATCESALSAADVDLAQMITAAQSADELPVIDDVLSAALDAVDRVDYLLHAHSLTEHRYFTGDAASLYSSVRKATGTLSRARRLARAASTRAAHEGVLLLTGQAGVGKTHVFCDVASRRLAEGRPTILLLGQEFDGRSLLGQFGELTQLGGSLDEVLEVLDAAAEAAGCIGLLMIDALNESDRPERWRADAQALVTSCARHSHVAVALSCRSDFVKAVVGDHQMASIEHYGFAEATDEAVRRFSEAFGLEPPTFPVLNPEFNNPLFLKLTCEALATLGATRFPFGSAGLTTVCNAFLEAVNKRLAEPSRCDFDEQLDLVGRVVRELALLDGHAMDRSEVQRITDAALPGRSWSRSLMRGLVAEGVLAELSDGGIVFGYQRLGDVARATALSERSLDDIRAWITELGSGLWRERGAVAALAVIVPERHGAEVADLLVDDKGMVSREFLETFLDSLHLRSPDSISPRTVAIVGQLLEDAEFAHEVCDLLIRIACVPRHPLNAQWLHERLATYDVSERDRYWSTWLVGTVDEDAEDEETAVSRLIKWAWPASLGDRPDLPDDIGVLATQLLGWFLTTPDRRVRDRATKALVSVAERAPAAFAEALTRFQGVNDPYVVERLTGAACGTALRLDDAQSIPAIAGGVLELVLTRVSQRNDG